MIKLSIIIPAYNAEPYLGELVECLSNQIIEGTDISSKTVEVIIVDDGSRQPVEYAAKWLKVIRQENKGSGGARNTGIDKAKGKYIAFVDADDLVANNFIKRVFEKIEKSPCDMCDLSWKSLTKDGAQFDRLLQSNKDRLTNPSACTRVFSKAFIGDVRFSEIKDATQDEDFSRRLGYLDPDKEMVHVSITDYMYFYRTAVEDSQVKKYKKGLRKTKRVVYYYPEVIKGMEWLVDDIKKDDELNEVFLLTRHCEIPELKRWCQIIPPQPIWTHYQKGEYYSGINIIPVPIKTQVCLFIDYNQIVGGIETFIYNFCSWLGDKYDITYVVNRAPDAHVYQMSKVVRVIHGQPNRQIICDTLIMLRILDKIPNNITYKHSIRMCHACKTKEALHIAQDCDEMINVSYTSKKSFGREAEDAAVIYNLTPKEYKKTLLLISATRIPAPDKGNNELRMRKLAQMLNDADIPFLWLNFSDGHLENPPKGFHNMGLYMDAANFFAHADYVVQLSDSEACPYSVLEALTQTIPVIVTEFQAAKELGVKDGVNGYVLPFNMDFDVKKLLNVPKFWYGYDNEMIVKEWETHLGEQKPFERYVPESEVIVEIMQTYYDIMAKAELRTGTKRMMTKTRAEYLMQKQLVRIIGGA